MLFILTLQPDLAQASSCFEVSHHISMSEHSSPCHQSGVDKASSHQKSTQPTSNQLSNCCDLGLVFLSFSTPPKIHTQFNQKNYAFNLAKAYHGLKLDLQDPPPRFL